MMWVVFAVLTALAMAIMLYPLVSPRRRESLSAPSETGFYREQLAEIERDVARGLLSQADAESARVEAARRLLRAAPDAADAPTRSLAPRTARLAAAAIFLIVPLTAIGLYLKLGQPTLPDQPLAARANDDASVEAIVAKVERHLRDKPDDGRGHEVLGPVYLRMGRFEDAERAFSEAARLLGTNPARLIGMAEARTAKAQGVVTASAREALEQAVKLDPKNPQAQFMLAVAAEQDQQPDKARALFEKMLAEAPPGTPWVSAVRERLTAIGGAPPDPAAGAPPAPAAGAPTGPAAEALAALPPAERQAQIRGMVEGLAARLAQNGQDVQGWLRLIRSWAMLGEKDKALAALAEARKALGADAGAVGQIETLAKDLGLQG